MASEAGDVSSRPRAVFIRGITRRSGTNYLSDLVRLHPDCARARTDVWEDFVLDDVDQLERYITRLSQRFPPPWPVPLADLRTQLLQEFGDGLYRTLVANPKRPDAAPVAKTPSVRGLEYFFDLFPHDPLLVIVRDGRAAVESLMKSFDLSFERAAREWVEGADTILRFRDRHTATEGSRWLLLRYEDLLTDPWDAVRKIEQVAGLSPGGIDPTAAQTLPVRGSSSFQTDEGAVHWKPREQDESFKPLERASAWDAERHRRFNWLAGRQLTELGYDLVGPPSAGLAERVRQQPRDVLAEADAAARRLRLRWLFRGLDARAGVEPDGV